MGITFFAKPYFLGNTLVGFDDTHVFRLSSRIRGEEVASFLGAKYNPKEGYEDDLLIYIKPRSLDRVRDIDWIDVVDGEDLIPKLKNRPDIRLIAMTWHSYTYLDSILGNKIILIPHHHINVENEVREDREVKVGGYIGGPSFEAFQIYGEARDWLKAAGFEFVTCYNFKVRHDAINFYKSIDFLVIVNFAQRLEHHKFATPIKMVNAASFGIPSIVRDVPAYHEFRGCYIPVNNMSELVEAAKKLRDKHFYEDFSCKIKEEAKRYHLSKVAGLYKGLKKERGNELTE